MLSVDRLHTIAAVNASCRSCCVDAVPPSGWRRRQSERHEVGGEDPDPPVGQFSLPPVVLGVGLGDDGDAVAGDEAQVAGLLTRVRVGRRDDELTAGSAHWRGST